MAHPTLSASKTQKTVAAATRVFCQNQEFQTQTTEPISQNLLKTMSDFFFCQLQLHINMYYHAKKIEKNQKQKFKLELKIVKKNASQNPQRFFNFRQLLKIFLKFLE